MGWNLRGKLGFHEHRRDDMSGGFLAVEPRKNSKFFSSSTPKKENMILLSRRDINENMTEVEHGSGSRVGWLCDGVGLA